MKDAYLQPYRDAQDEHGSAFGVTLWAGPKSQKLRFGVFCDMVDFKGKKVLDAGCSRGDFADYMIEKGVKYKHYVGVDGLPVVIEHATARGLRDAKFVAGDFVQQPEWLATGEPDFVTISGTLNTMEDSVALGVLKEAWGACREGLVFNFLSDRTMGRAPVQEYPARRLPTLKLLDWAMSQTPAVRMRQDYFQGGHDATILMVKE